MARSKSIALLVMAILTGPSAIAADINDGLIAWYPFDKGVVDKTGNIEPIEGESILPILKGKFGGAVKLDGDTFIAIPIDLGPDLHPSITISIWVKTDPRPADAELEKDLPSRKYIVSESIAVEGLNSDSTYFFGYALGRAIVGPKHTTRRGQWQHVAVVRTIEDRPNAKGEIEPHVVSQFHSGGRMSELVVPFRGQGMATDLYLGTNSPRYKHKFRGAVDELRIYDRAMSQDEIGLLAKASSNRTAENVAENENMGSPDNVGPTDTSPLDNVNASGQSIGDIAVDNPTGDVSASNDDASIYDGLTSGNPFSVPDSQADDLSRGIDDPDIEGRQYVADWRLVGMLPLTEEQLASGVYPGSELTIKIRLKKDDAENKIPDVRLELNPLEGRTKKVVSLTEVTSESSPTAQRDVPIILTVPEDISFSGNASATSWRPVATILNRNGLQLRDSDPGNHQRELSIQVSRPTSDSDCGAAVTNDDGTRTVGGCLAAGDSEEDPEIYIDHEVLVFTDLPFEASHENDAREVLLFDTGEPLEGMKIIEKNDKACWVRLYGQRFIPGQFAEGHDIASNHCPGGLSLGKDIKIGLDRDSVITGIKVCRNRANNRLKGVHVVTRKIQSDGTLSPSTSFDEDELTNCFKWTPVHDCHPGSAAAGVRLMISSGAASAKNDFIHSIDLACGEIKVREGA